MTQNIQLYKSDKAKSHFKSDKKSDGFDAGVMRARDEELGGQDAPFRRSAAYLLHSLQQNRQAAAQFESLDFCLLLMLR
jgi:hypothetical protein